jgi:integrase
MHIKELHPTAVALYEKLKSDMHSKSILGTAQWVIGHFEKYCTANGIETVDMPLVAQFLAGQYDIDCYAHPVAVHMQSVIRRPLLILMEFYESGSYCKTHQRGSTTEIPLEYEAVFVKYRDFVNGLDISIKTKARKLWVATSYLAYLVGIGILDTKDFSIGDAQKYMNTIERYAHATRRIIASTLREMFEWLYANGITAFSGRDVFPLLRKSPKSDIMSYYSKDEIMAMLDAIDTTTNSGKTTYFIFCITAFLGIRAGDLVNLKVRDIDWENNCISIVQRKTGNPITWPLVDEVKYPLLDYLKNVRHDSVDKDYVLIKAHAPYERYTCTSSVWKAVSSCVEKAGFADKGRHRGPHSLRHSLATNLMKENVPLSAISSIMGHSSTRTTEIYLTVDETHLKELTLEVPYALQNP